MEISFSSVQEVKIKFGRLLSQMHYGAHLELENINEKLISSPFLDFFERSDFALFLNSSNERIIQELFNNLFSFDDHYPSINPLYWSGIQYMNIFLNLRIPLKVIFLTLPLKEMIRKYDIYHELNEIELVKDYLNNEYQNKSILAYFRHKKDLSVTLLSKLTNISSPTLRHYEISNKNFYQASSSNTVKLKEILSIDDVFLRKESKMFPFFSSLLFSEDYLSCLTTVLQDYYPCLNNEKIHLSLSEDYSTRNVQEGATLYLSEFPHLLTRKKDLYLDEKILFQLLRNSLDLYLSKYLKENLVF